MYRLLTHDVQAIDLTKLMRNFNRRNALCIQELYRRPKLAGGLEKEEKIRQGLKSIVKEENWFRSSNTITPVTCGHCGPRNHTAGLVSNPGEGMDVSQCTVPSRQGSTLRSRRAVGPLVKLVEEEERKEDLTPSGCSTSKLKEKRAKL
ncbi:hypothetical protein TNCV_3629801 [Trichonephila clavipes]|nr:hypothetical protein TNCV_3629801 [Trichonephila clavipes]